MSSLGSPNPFFIAGKKAYEVERSLRWDGGTGTDAPQLKRTGSSTSSSYTVSMWFKYAGVGNNLFNLLFSLGQSNDSDSAFMGINNNDNFVVYNNGGYQFTSTRKFRDPSAWYHFTMSVNSNSYTLYINNESLDTGTLRSLDTSSDGLRIGVQYGNYYPFAGYIADFYLIDGSALTPSSFAETDAVTGEYKPKKYTGGFGTSGAYLLFDDNSGTTATTLGKDSSGNSNNFTPSNFVTGDAVKDSPTNNFATLRLYGTPPESGAGLTEGNLEFTTGSSGSGSAGNRLPFNTIIPTSGKWYVEVMPTTTNLIFVGVHPYQVEIAPSSSTTRWQGIYSYNGESYLASTSSTASNSTHAASYGNEDVIGMYINMDASTPEVYFSKNGQWANGSGSWNQSSPTSAIALGGTFFTTSTGGLEGIGISIRSASSSSSVSAQVNFGQDSTFSGVTTAGGNADENGIGDFKYTVPANALALCTANLGKPTIAFPDNHFDTLLWTGNSTDNRAITGLNFQPDLTWIKRRSGGAQSHFWVDALRSNTDGSGGNGNVGPLATNDNYAETNTLTDGGFESFNSDGFTLGKGSSTANADAPYQRNNASGGTYVGWNWKAGGSASSNSDGTITSSVSVNASAGFSIITWTGTGSAGTIGHGLGVAPKWLVVKLRSGSQDWFVNNGMILNDYGKYFKWNSTNTAASDTNVFPNTAPTSTVFSVGTDSAVNASSSTYVAYVFSEVAGYSKFGSFVGNGNADGSFVYTGFRPAYVMIKCSSTSDHWNISDAKRGNFNEIDEALYANNAEAEGWNGSLDKIDYLSNGFKPRANNSQTNASGATYIYLAFAESPFKYARAR